MRRKLLPFILGTALSIAAIGPVAAGNHNVNDCDIDIDQRGGGAAALAALIAAAVDADVAVPVCNVSVELLNNSLNNLLQNADIRALNNILNNSPILSGFTISLDDVDILNGVQVNVLSGGVVIHEITVVPEA